jgi:hypothetical protein
LTGWLLPDQKFRERLFLGYGYTALVANRLQAAGVVAYQPPLKIVQGHDEIPLFRLETDLHVFQGNIEVKSSRYEWSDDPVRFPFPIALPDTVVGWDRKEAAGHCPIAIVLVSQPTGGMLYVPMATRPRWRAQTLYDSGLGQDELYYVVDKKELASFDALVRELRA